jgi:hypothetical protein
MMTADEGSSGSPAHPDVLPTLAQLAWASAPEFELSRRERYRSW